MPAARLWILWTLLLIALASIPTGIFSRSTPSATTIEVDRLDALENENAALREQVDELRSAVANLQQQATAVHETRDALPPHVDVLERWPVPKTLRFADEVVPLDDPAVHARIEDEWARYLVNRHWLISWLRRSRDVFPTVEAKLAAAGLPDDLKYVVVVESGLRARAYSSAGAVGYWQFIRSTGQRYGLVRNSWRDDRRNLESSTDAAIAYLSEMYEEFESWPLVLAGFNAGEKRVRTSIEEQGTRDYYSMVLPSETEAYWFRAVVLKELLGHPERYDLHLPDDGWTARETARVRLRVKAKKLALREITEACGMGYREFKELNPELRRSWLPAGTHELVVPADRADAFVEAFPRAKKVASVASGAALSEAPDRTPPRP